MASKQAVVRMQRELQILSTSSLPGIVCWPVEGNIFHLEADIAGPKGSPYEKGTFRIEVHVPERYPFEPPKPRFITSVYHPNIDSAGRICLDILKMPPNGAWKPSINISTMLTSIQQLLGEPNPDDALDGDIGAECKHNRVRFEAKARAQTLRHATCGTVSGSTGVDVTGAIAPQTPAVRSNSPKVDGPTDQARLFPKAAASNPDDRLLESGTQGSQESSIKKRGLSLSIKGMGERRQTGEGLGIRATDGAPAGQHSRSAGQDVLSAEAHESAKQAVSKSSGAICKPAAAEYKTSSRLAKKREQLPANEAVNKDRIAANYSADRGASANPSPRESSHKLSADTKHSTSQQREGVALDDGDGRNTAPSQQSFTARSQAIERKASDILRAFKPIGSQRSAQSDSDGRASEPSSQSDASQPRLSGSINSRASQMQQYSSSNPVLSSGARGGARVVWDWNEYGDRYQGFGSEATSSSQQQRFDDLERVKRALDGDQNISANKPVAAAAIANQKAETIPPKTGPGVGAVSTATNTNRRKKLALGRR